MRLPLLLLFPATALALRITSITHSGPGCPQDSTVDWEGSLDDLVFNLDGFRASVGTAQTTQCQLHLTLGDGNRGQRLVLRDVEVWGGLRMAAGAEAEFYTTAYWSEDAANEKTKKSTTSKSSTFDSNVAVRASLGLASQCVGSDGYVGILNVGFRVVSKQGTVTFGPQRGGAGTLSPVEEHLDLYWASC